jgi:hypothetical protein
MAVGSSAVSQGGETAYIYGANILSSHYDFMKATLQTSLYDVATEQLVWSSTVTTSDSDSTARVSRDLGRFFYDSLRRDGLL